ncbi:hypothetical protein SAMN06298226_2570 [Nitrosovibrio sp. Nv4]|nr:hypothetical protein SAMN06298226_2570 [Nitrosovibrio sp. Nv4]
MQHQLQTHAALFCQKTGQLHHGTRRYAGDGFSHLRERHCGDLALYLTRFTCFDLTRDVTDPEFGYGHACWCVPQTTDIDKLAANYSLVTVQLTCQLRLQAWFL